MRLLRTLLVSTMALSGAAVFAQSVNPFVRSSQPAVAAVDPIAAAATGAATGPVGMGISGMPVLNPKGTKGPALPPTVPPVPGSFDKKDAPMEPELPEVHVKFVGEVNGITVLRAGTSSAPVYHFNKDKRVSVKLLQDAVPAPLAPAGAGSAPKPTTPAATTPAAASPPPAAQPNPTTPAPVTKKP